MNNDHNIHIIAKKLQHEVDSILRDVDEKTLFAEFREEEMFDIQNGDAHEVVSHTLDERIFTRRSDPRRRFGIGSERITHIRTPMVKRSKLAQLFHYLFKPLQY